MGRERASMYVTLASIPSTALHYVWPLGGGSKEFRVILSNSEVSLGLRAIYDLEWAFARQQMLGFEVYKQQQTRHSSNFTAI